MTIAIDYDGTWTRDPRLFTWISQNACARGHIPIIVTRRSENEIVDGGAAMNVARVVYTNGQPKKAFMEALGWHVDIWIDDFPETING